MQNPGRKQIHSINKRALLTIMSCRMANVWSYILYFILLLWLINKRCFTISVCLPDDSADLVRYNHLSGNFEQEICPELARIQNLNVRSVKGNFARTCMPKIRWTKHGYLCLWLPEVSLYHDLELNPRPVRKKSQCGTCNKTVRTNQAAILCSDCTLCFHPKCLGLTKETIQKLNNSTQQWLCFACSLPQFSDSFFESSDFLSNYSDSECKFS